jgi:phosphoribosyl-ATP pyrophosphohydrolase
MTIEALQAEIGLWHRETFGEDCRISRILQKFEEEADELLLHGNTLSEEAADCMIVLLALCDRIGVSAQDCIRTKLDVVKVRDQAARDRERGIPEARKILKRVQCVAVKAEGALDQLEARISEWEKQEGTGNVN